MCYQAHIKIPVRGGDTDPIRKRREVFWIFFKNLKRLFPIGMNEELVLK